MRTTAAVACLLCGVATPAAGFVAPGLQQTVCRSSQHSTHMTAAGAGTADRRGFLAAAVSSAAVALAVAPSEATVYFEIDRYGDKELKLGTVSKIRQAWRNKMLESPELAPAILSLAITDALGYNARVRAHIHDTSCELCITEWCACRMHFEFLFALLLHEACHQHSCNLWWLQGSLCRDTSPTRGCSTAAHTHTCVCTLHTSVRACARPLTHNCCNSFATTDNNRRP
jgi:hypothetical protein